MDPQKFNRLLEKLKYDKQALNEIFEEYYPKIVAHVGRRFGRLVNGEDVAQDIFLTLMKLKEIKFIERPTAWLLRLVDNRAIDMLKARRDTATLPEILPDTSFSIDNTILQADVKEILSHLDPVSQRILYLHHWEGYEYREIAEVLHLSCGNVRIKAHRAYKDLRKYL